METFVVRIWAPADETERTFAPADVQGRLEHVTSGRDWTFRGVDELGRLIHGEVSVRPGSRAAIRMATDARDE